jgi:hypothetical protein
MSKQAQYEAEEKQGFLAQQQPQYVQQQPQGMYVQPLPQQAMYTTQPMYAQMPAGVQIQQQPVRMQQYPPAQTVVVVNQVAGHPAGGWKDPGCCTICWGVFLLICALLSAGSAITAMSAVTTARNNIPDPDWLNPDEVTRYTNAIGILGIVTSIVSSAMASNIIMGILTIAVVVFYCKRSTSPAARAWNYACWILIAIIQSGNVILGVIISLVITTAGAFFIAAFSGMTSALNQSGNGSNNGMDPTGPVTFGVSIVTGIAWAATAITAIPMIISSVVAHKNKARCSCSTHTPDYVN